MRLARPASWSLMVKIPAAIAAAVVGSALLIALVVVDQNWRRAREGFEARLLMLAEVIAANAAPAILERDVWALYRMLQGRLGDRGSGASSLAGVEAVFLDPTGTVLAHTDPARHPVGLPLWDDRSPGAELRREVLGAREPRVLPAALSGPAEVDAVAPIIVGDRPVGYLLLRMTTEPLIAAFYADQMIILTLTLALALFASAVGVTVSVRLVSPLRRLSDGLAAVARGEAAEAEPLNVRRRDEIGRLAERFNLMIRELAEKRRLERELARTERLAGLGRFAAGLAHEVNNPLGGILNCVSMLRARPGDEALVRRYLPLIEGGLKRIATTMTALLGELRGDVASRRCGLACACDLEGVVRAEIGARPIDLDWRIDPGSLAGVNIECTCPHVHQILLNLVRNAVQAMPEGGRLRVAAERQGGELRIEVADSGPGIAPEDQERVFEPFFTSKPGGSGLGLWLSYRLARRMGGSLTLRSTPGAGAAFILGLPVKEMRTSEPATACGEASDAA